MDSESAILLFAQLGVSSLAAFLMLLAVFSLGAAQVLWLIRNTFECGINLYSPPTSAESRSNLVAAMLFTETSRSDAVAVGAA